MNLIKKLFWGNYRFYSISTSVLFVWMFFLDTNDLSVQYRLWDELSNIKSEKTYYQKKLKELEKEQKTRSTRMVRDGLDAALLDIATFYRDVMMVQAGSSDALINKELENEINAYAANNKAQATINKIGAIMEARVNLGHNAAPLLTVEALMCVLAR